MSWLDTVGMHGENLLGGAWPVVWNLVKIVALVAPLMLCVAYLTLWERKMIGFMHLRIGPNRVGFKGLLQPIADGLKLMLKEIIVPTQASKVLYILAPIMTIMPALAAWVVIPFGPDRALANVNAGLLLLLALTSLEVYGVILAGWASNSKYAFLGGWQPFFTGVMDFGPQWFWDWFWLFLKTFFMVSLFVWFRASFPRYRYDQIMRLGWKVFIPVTLVWLIVVAVWMQTPLNIWK